MFLMVFFRHSSNHADRQFAYCFIPTLERMSAFLSHKLSHAHDILVACICFDVHLDCRDENSLGFCLHDRDGSPADGGREVLWLIRPRMRCELPDMRLWDIDDQRIVFDLFRCQRSKALKVGGLHLAILA